MSPTTGGGWDNLSGSIQMLGVYWSWSVEGLEVSHCAKEKVSNQYCPTVQFDGGLSTAWKQARVSSLAEGTWPWMRQRVCRQSTVSPIWRLSKRLGNLLMFVVP